MEESVHGNEPIIPYYFEQLHQFFESDFNWLDLPIFLFGIFLILFVFWIFFRKQGKKAQEKIGKIATDYEKQIRKIKENHIGEIRHLEEMMQAFKEKLSINKMNADYKLFELKQERAVLLEEEKKMHAKKHLKIQKIYEKDRAKKGGEIFELKGEIAMLRKRQIKEIEGFQKQIRELKDKIQSLHETHAQEIEKSELEIADLRKQIDALVFKV